MKPVTKEIFLDSIKKSIQNATELIEEAKLLKSKNHISRSYSLFHLGIEEIGKAIMIYFFILFEDFENISLQNLFHKSIREHKDKILQAVNIDIMIALLTKDKEIQQNLLKSIIKQQESINDLNNYKNASLYVSFINSKVYSPSEMINNKMLTEIESHAESRLFVSKPFLLNGIDNFEETKEFLKLKTKDELERSTIELMESKFGI